MKLLLLCPVFLLSSIVGVYPSTAKNDACNCDHCLLTNINVGKSVITDDVICARARDYPDRHFRSVCHMLCFNRCTRFKVKEIIEDDVKRYVTTAYRTNYYKLRDGLCDAWHM